jgi:hypothetical protein
MSNIERFESKTALITGGTGEICFSRAKVLAEAHDLPYKPLPYQPHNARYEVFEKKGEFQMVSKAKPAPARPAAGHESFFGKSV